VDGVAPTSKARACRCCPLYAATSVCVAMSSAENACEGGQRSSADMQCRRLCSLLIIELLKAGQPAASMGDGR
jgi:hypothetical protein